MWEEARFTVWLCVFTLGLTTLTTAQTPSQNTIGEVTRGELGASTAENVPTSNNPTPAITQAKPPAVTTLPQVIIGERPKPTTTPAPAKRYISNCASITLQCTGDLTVYVDNVYRGRKRNESCTEAKKECCEATLDSTDACIEENTATAVLNLQRTVCLQNPGQACDIFGHSSLDINCEGKLMLSHFNIIAFHCIYVPIPTKNISLTTTITQSSPEVTEEVVTTTPEAPTQQTTEPLEVVTPKPLPIAIIAGSAGGGVFLIIVIILIICCTRRRKQRIMKQDMTKPELGLKPVSEIGVNYMEDERSTKDPDIIQTGNRYA